MSSKIYSFIKKYLKGKGQKSYRKYSMAKEILFCVICLLLTFAAIRLYSLYNLYTYTTEKQEVKISKMLDNDINAVLHEVLMSSYKNVYFTNKNEASNLQINLIENHGVDKVHDSLVNGKYTSDIYKTFMDSFNDLYNANNSDYDEGTFVANDEGFIFVETNNKLDKFNSIKKANKVVPWKNFIANMKNPEVTKKAFADAYFKSYATNPVIIRLDGNYNGNRYYTIDDLCRIYIEEGIDGLKGFGFLVSSTLTENGDIYGNVDSTFMQSNDVHKLYVYKYVDVCVYLKDHEKALNEMDGTINTIINDLQLEKKVSMLITVVSIFLIVLCAICLMIVYRELNNNDLACCCKNNSNNEDE